MDENINIAAGLIKNSNHLTVFTGSGISVESGIPSFRGPEGIWNRYDPNCLDIEYFVKRPYESWNVIKEIFYDFFGKASPNDAHRVIAEMEKRDIVKTIITQNIDDLHQQAGSKNVLEFHGNCRQLRCMECNTVYQAEIINLEVLPPRCSHCDGLLKPDFIFFGEGIPEPANSLSFKEAEIADVFLVIGTTGEVMPACMIPQIAKSKGCKIIEINTQNSLYTRKITDVFIQGKAGLIMSQLGNLIL